MNLSGKILVAVLLLLAVQQVTAQLIDPSVYDCDRIANQVDASCNSPTEICDPCYKLQWHLKNTGQTTDTSVHDINVEPVWKKGNLGQGIFIGIMDEQVFDHEDLRDNLSTQYSHDYYPNTTDTNTHGIRVAGIAAASANRIGLRGVAPQATIYSLNHLSGGGSKSTINAMVRHAPITAVANNSWGVRIFTTFGGKLWEKAIETGISKGFYGKGTVYVFGAGNYHCFNGANGWLAEEDVCGARTLNYEGNANYHAVIAVGAVNHLDKVSRSSERGANLWLCAPSNNDVYGDIPGPGIWTTGERSSRLNPSSYSRGGGTSSSVPIVSGVVALMRHANPNLTWRDVKLILANTARRNNPKDAGWLVP